MSVCLPGGLLGEPLFTGAPNHRSPYSLQGDDKAYLERLIQCPQIKSHSHFVAPKQRNGTFVINHYAGTVAYTVDEFCEKNKDLLAVDIVNMIQVRESIL